METSFESNIYFQYLKRSHRLYFKKIICKIVMDIRTETSIASTKRNTIKCAFKRRRNKVNVILKNTYSLTNRYMLDL
jgi:hypothetical protein